MKLFLPITFVLFYHISLLAQLDAGEDFTICNGDTGQLQATGDSNYTYTSEPYDASISNPNISNPY